MRIGIDISQLVYTGSGVSVYTEQLVSHLLKIDKKNEYLLFGSSLRRADRFDVVNHFFSQTLVKRKIFAFPQTLLRLLWNQLHLVDIETFIGRVDVFHTSDWIEPPAQAKKVSTIHDLLVYKYPEYMHPTIVTNQRRKLKWVKKESDLIIVDSQSTADDVAKILNIEKDRLRVIYLGVSEQFVPQPAKNIERIKQKYKIKKDYLLTIGGSQPRKNVRRVIDACQSVIEKENLQLVVVGRFLPEDKLRLNDDVVLIEYVAYEDLPALYSGAECFIYPSLYEGFGLPVLEAMKCGCPVVTSNRGSLKEISGDAAIVVEPQSVEAIREGIKKAIYCSDEEYIKRVKKGFSWTKKFTWEETARKTLQVYQEAVSKT